MEYPAASSRVSPVIADLIGNLFDNMQIPAFAGMTRHKRWGIKSMLRDKKITRVWSEVTNVTEHQKRVDIRLHLSSSTPKGSGYATYRFPNRSP